MFSRFLTALQFLTVLPLHSHIADSNAVARSLPFFPVVGLLLGNLLASWYILLSLLLPTAIVPLILVISLLMLTGALHFDGLADSCDGLFGYQSVARRLEIMQDSRVGSFGLAGGWGLLTLKYLALANIAPTFIIVALVLAPFLARWSMLVLIISFPYGRASGLGVLYKLYNGRQLLFRLSLLVGLATVWLAGWVGVGVMLACLVMTLLFGKWVMTKLPDGLTGDNYGAGVELTETLVWLIFASLRP